MLHNKVIKGNFCGEFSTLELHLCASQKVIDKIYDYITLVCDKEPKAWEKDSNLNKL